MDGTYTVYRGALLFEVGTQCFGLNLSMTITNIRRAVEIYCPCQGIIARCNHDKAFRHLITQVHGSHDFYSQLFVLDAYFIPQLTKN